MKKEEIINKKLHDLSLSKFRSNFHLNKEMKEFTKKKGLTVITKHTYDIINKRLREKNPKNDGKQTPMRQVHPTFIAQHACACCCRSCLQKWHHISKDKDLNNKEVNYIVELIMEWIKREIK